MKLCEKGARLDKDLQVFLPKLQSLNTRLLAHRDGARIQELLKGHDAPAMFTYLYRLVLK